MLSVDFSHVRHIEGILLSRLAGVDVNTSDLLLHDSLNQNLRGKARSCCIAFVIAMIIVNVIDFVKIDGFLVMSKNGRWCHNHADDRCNRSSPERCVVVKGVSNPLLCNGADPASVTLPRGEEESRV